MMLTAPVAGVKFSLPSNTRGAVLQLPLPLGNLVGMDAELTGQLGHRLVPFDRRQGHFRIERFESTLTRSPDFGEYHSPRVPRLRIH